MEVRAIQESGLLEILKQTLNADQRSTPSPADSHDSVYERVKRFIGRHQGKKPLDLGSPGAFKKNFDENPQFRRAVLSLANTETKIESAMQRLDGFESTVSELLSNDKSIKALGHELLVALRNGEHLSLQHLSSGEKHLLKLLLSCLTSGPNTVLIDEPELSMHIEWQRAFVSKALSLNPRTQLILASHSPEVMADLPDEAIFRL